MEENKLFDDGYSTENIDEYGYGSEVEQPLELVDETQLPDYALEEIDSLELEDRNPIYLKAGEIDLGPRGRHQESIIALYEDGQFLIASKLEKLSKRRSRKIRIRTYIRWLDAELEQPMPDSVRFWAQDSNGWRRMFDKDRWGGHPRTITLTDEFTNAWITRAHKLIREGKVKGVMLGRLNVI